jgi:hypothetical protein
MIDKLTYLSKQQLIENGSIMLSIWSIPPSALILQKFMFRTSAFDKSHCIKSISNVENAATIACEHATCLPQSNSLTPGTAVAIGVGPTALLPYQLIASKFEVPRAVDCIGSTVLAADSTNL